MAVAADLRRWTQWCLMLLLVATWSCASAAVLRAGEQEEGQVVRTAKACELAPHWTALAVNRDGVEEARFRDPMLENRGKVIVVALTSASSLHSLQQADKLGSLESYFHGIDMTDVVFVLVNSAESKEQLEDLLLRNLTMMVVQEDDKDHVWSKLGGRKDHVFIYDRCGRLTYAIPFPLSIIHPRQQLVESSVISTYLDDLCGVRKCSVDSKNVSNEDLADGELLNTTHSSLINVTQIINVTEQALDEELNETSLSVVYYNSSESELDLEDGFKDEEQNSLNTSRTRYYPRTTPAVRSTTRAPILWSLYKKVLRYLPWSSKEKSNERDVNSVRQFNNQEKQESEDSTALPATVANETDAGKCNASWKDFCEAWPKKKLDHARICCDLHSCNRSAQYLKKHCKHYPAERCKKVQLILKCCQSEENKKDKADPRAAASFDPKS